MKHFFRTLAMGLAFNLAAAGGLRAQTQSAPAQPTSISDTIATHSVLPEQKEKDDVLPRSSHYAAVAIDHTTGKILYAYQANKRLYPASTTKVMTAYLVFKALQDGKLTMDQTIPISRHAALAGTADGAVNLGLVRKGKLTATSMTVHDALLATIIRSANDAAVVIAEAVAGSEEKFIALMNKTARDMGMKNTHFTTPNGMPDPAQVTTVSDMAILCSNIIRDFPEYYPLFETPNGSFRGNVYKNHNNLLENYPGADGIKTGWTVRSGSNMTASAIRGGERVIVVVFGAKNKDQRLNDVCLYLDFGFEKITNPDAVFDATAVAERLKNKEYYVVSTGKDSSCVPTLNIDFSSSSLDTANIENFIIFRPPAIDDDTSDLILPSDTIPFNPTPSITPTDTSAVKPTPHLRRSPFLWLKKIVHH